MRRVVSILASGMLLLSAGCDIPKVLTRISYAQFGADGIAVGFYPRSEDSSGAGGDTFLSTAADIGALVAPLFGFVF